MEDMVSDGTTIKYHLWNEVYYRNDMWSGRSTTRRAGDSTSKLIIEISEKKRRWFCLFLLVLLDSVRLLLFSLGGWGRGTFPECSFEG